MPNHRKDLPEDEIVALHLPKNTPAGLFIAVFAFIFGFSMIWHLWVLAPIGLIGIILTVLIRTTSGEHEEVVSVKTINQIEASMTSWKDYAREWA